MERRGFTLVELAIVLVIIGLLIGAILKGQELINNAKFKRLVSDLQGISAAVYSYYDRYKAYPGDDPNARSRWGSRYRNIRSGNGNGLIDGSPASTSISSESIQAWKHLMAAGFIPGDPGARNANSVRPSSPYGGRYGLTNREFYGRGRANCIFVDNLPADIAQRLDAQLDDGIWNRGSIQANRSYNNSGLIDICYRI
jgi:prepilin-type N-terminal cleavage/methylation domain-containing protein